MLRIALAFLEKWKPTQRRRALHATTAKKVVMVAAHQHSRRRWTGGDKPFPRTSRRRWRRGRRRSTFSRKHGERLPRKSKTRSATGSAGRLSRPKAAQQKAPRLSPRCVSQTIELRDMAVVGQ